MHRSGGKGEGEVAAFPWRGVLHLGLCLLRLPPEIFWAMTPAEFHIATGGLSRREASIDRARLTAMMAQFPD